MHRFYKDQTSKGRSVTCFKNVFVIFCLIGILGNSTLIGNQESDNEICLGKAPRNIYLDLGAFQGDTLQMFRLNGVPTRCHPQVDWEVFAFEACPLLAHATQLQVDQLNGCSVDAPISYTDIPHMQELVDRVYRLNLPFNSEQRDFFEKYEQILTSRISSRGIFNSQSIQTLHQQLAQLNEATNPLPQIGTRYTAYAMGVGAEDTTLEMRWSYSNYINGGGNLLGIDYGKVNHIFIVPVIKLSRWIKESFSKDDYIYIKMDIEGMEFLLLDDLITSGCLEYINEMDVEWHGRFNVPGKENESRLRQQISNAGIILRDHY